MKFQHTITENIVREGKDYYIVHLKGLISREEYGLLLDGMENHEVKLSVDNSTSEFDASLRKAEEELSSPPEEPKTEVKRRKSWLQ